MNPFEVLTVQEILGRALRSTRSGWRQAFMVTPFPFDSTTEQRARQVEEMRRIYSEALDHAELFGVERDIASVIDQAGQRLHPEHQFVFQPHDFPGPLGLIHLGGADIRLPSDSFPDGQLLIGLLYLGFELDSSRDHGKAILTICETLDKERGVFGPYIFRHFMPLPYDRPYVPRVNSADDYLESAGLPALTDPEVRIRADQQALESADRVLRWLYTWCHFLQSKLLYHRSADVPVQQQKVMRKEGRPIPPLRIVYLRGYERGPQADEPHEVSWTHRWLVRGHWRQQRVGPGLTSTRPTWIPGHVKGPADKPLIVRTTVQAVVR
jgi:hypothetical protein